MILKKILFTTRRVIVNSTGAGPEPFSGRGPSLLESESVYRTFSEWIISQKLRLRPNGLYVVGVYGSVGQGKTVFSQAIASRLNALLKPEEGQAITRSLDDYYLTKRERYLPEFLALGYNPEGISNRGPAGTHDVEQLLRDIRALEESRPDSCLELPSFDKSIDDHSPEPYRVQGKVGVFVLEGWFIGANTNVDPAMTEPGLKRSMALALKNYQPVFERIDALWAFEPPGTLEEIIAQRAEQEETLRRATGKVGMSPDEIRRFVEYFYKEAWQEGVTSPVPPRKAASFWASTDIHHRFVKITPEWP
jgi:pantothenate kinase-related protein Tda10